MEGIVSRLFQPDPKLCCEACAFGKGEHADFCEAAASGLATRATFEQWQKQARELELINDELRQQHIRELEILEDELGRTLP